MPNLSYTVVGEVAKRISRPINQHPKKPKKRRHDDGDPYWANVKLLLHMNGVNGGTSFPDSGPLTKTVTRSGVTTQTGTKKYGTASGYWRTSFPDYLSVPYVTGDFDWWGTDFTIEGWIYTTSWSAWTMGYGSSFCGNRDGGGSTNYWSFGPLSTGKLHFYYYSGSANNIYSTGTMSLSAWHHIAMTHVQSSGAIKLFIDGVLDGSGTRAGTPLSSASYPLFIGGASGHLAYKDDFRITRGTARYTANFTPPIMEFPDS